MEAHRDYLLLPLFILQLFQLGTSLQCNDLLETPTLNDTIQPNTSLFSIDGFKKLLDCPVQDYFDIQNNTFVLKKSFTDYCDNPTCTVTCDTGVPGAKPLNASLPLDIKRFSNYTIQFLQPQSSFTVTESIPNGTNILKQGFNVSIKECRVGDLGRNALRTFELLNNPSDLFKWGPETSNSVLLVKKDIDYEAVQNVTLTLQASLMYQQKLFSTVTTTLEISIQDMDDNPPKFEQDVYTVDIQEENSTVINNTLPINPKQVHAYDQDRGIDQEIEYSIEDPSGLFSINSSTGEVHVTSVLDRECQDRYYIVIKASQTDKDYSSATATLIVNVTDIDDHLPVFKLDNYTVTLSEHSAIGSYITKVTAVDDDLGVNADFTYKLSNDSVPVNIDDTQGILSVKDKIDFDRETYGDTIMVQVLTVTYDNRTGQNNVTVIILLDDINDHNPNFVNSSYHFIVGNMTGTDTIGKVAATDKDKGPNSNVTYSFMESTQTQTDCQRSQQDFPFKIDTLTGDITLNSSPPLFCSRYNAFIRGCDNPSETTNRRCAWSEIVITSSTSRNRTKVSQINQTLGVFENMGTDKIVGTLRCTGSKYTYSGDNVLYVSNTGLVMTKESLDREKKDTHQGVVKVEDSNGDIICQISVTVAVLDANDHAPKFVKDEYSFELPDDVTPGKIIGKIIAVDDDVGTNADISYFIKPSGDFETFTMNASTGTIHLGSLSQLTKDVYRLLVGATDNGSPRLESMASVYITKSSSDNYTIPLSTPLSTAAIYVRKQHLESDMSLILKLSVTISTVKASSNAQDLKIKSVICIAARTNDSSPVSKPELQRALLLNYEAIRALFYQDMHKADDNSSDKGLRAPEIALIVMAAVILIGAIVAIIIISKQFSSHKKYRRLYENLTRNSSIYESQEIKINMDDETSDYNGSLTTQDLERTEAKTSDDAIACVNPLFDNALVSENDSGNVSDANQDVEGITNRNRTDSEQALDSLARLSDMLDKEDSEPKLAGGESVAKSGSGELELNSQSQDIDAVSNEATNDFSITTNNKNIVEQLGSQELNNDTARKYSKEQTQIDNVVSQTDEPNPDYDLKQVRFNTEVLDTDDNKFEPLKENEGGRKFPKRMIDRAETKFGAISNDAADEVFVDDEMIDDMRTDERSLEPTSDEPGWVEEEINSPNTSVSIDDIGTTELNTDLDVSTHF